MILIQKFFSWLKCLPKKDLFESVMYLVVALYPILPSYFAIMGQRVSTLISLCLLPLLFFSFKFWNFRVSLSQFIIIFSCVFLIFLPSMVTGTFLETSTLSLFSNFFMVPFYFCLIANTQEKRDKCLSIIIVVALIVSLFSLTEQFGFNIFSLIETIQLVTGSKTMARFGIMRAESSFGTAINFGIYLSFVIVLVYYKLITKRVDKIWKRNVLIGILLYLNITLLSTVSRFPIMVAIFVNFVCFCFLDKKDKKTLAIGFLGVCFIALLIGGDFLSSFVSNIIGSLSGKLTTDENPFIFRFALFDYFRALVDGEYIFGLGLRANVTFWTYLDGYIYVRATFDNSYLFSLISFGVVGTVGWAIYYLYPLFICARDWWKDKKFINLAAFLIIAICLLNFLSVARMTEANVFSILFGMMFSRYLEQSKGPAVSYSRISI